MSFWDNVIGYNDSTEQKSNLKELISVDDKIYKKIIDTTTIYEPKGDKMIYVTKSGAFIKFEFLDNNETYIKKIERYFTLKKKMLIGPTKQLKCCKLDKTKKRIIVPRFGIFELLNNVFHLSDCTTKSQIYEGDNMSQELRWTGNLTYNQKIIAQYICNNYYTKKRVSHGSAGCILNLEAGQGKSYLAAYMIHVIKKKTAVILHSTSLMMQWDKVLKNTFGSNINIGYYYGKKKTDGDIVLMIIDSAASDIFNIGGNEKNALDYYNQFGFIIYDECHLYSYKSAQKVLNVAQAPYVLGLSATPDEHSYGFDRAVWWALGPVLNARELPGYRGVSENFIADVHRIMYYGPPEHTRNITNTSTASVMVAPTINMICSDPHRMALVVDCIKKGLDKDLYMFVFADRREYLLNLKKILKHSEKIDGDIVDNDTDFVRIVGGAKDEDMENAERKSKVIFTTYQYMGTGKSIIKMNGLVLATPRKSKMKQYINRIFRLGSDASIRRHIWDICDMKTKLSNQWSHRSKYYAEKNYEIDAIKIKYEQFTDQIDIISKILKNKENSGSPSSDARIASSVDLDEIESIDGAVAIDVIDGSINEEEIDGSINEEEIDGSIDVIDSINQCLKNKHTTSNNKKVGPVEIKSSKKYPDGSLQQNDTKERVKLDHKKRLEITQLILNKIME